MMSMLKKYPWRVVLVLAAALALVWWGWRHWMAPVPAPALITAPVQRGHIEDTVLATGAIQAAQLVNVGAQVGGQITKIHVQVGDQVKKGQLIAEIDATTQRNNLRAAQQQVAALQAQLAARQGALTQAQRNVQRQRYLAEHHATSVLDQQNATQSLIVARAELQALQAQIAQYNVQVQTAKANVGYTRITAPQDGTVVSIVAKEGQTVAASQIAPTIVKLANLDAMRIEAQISEADVPRVRSGMPAYFTILGDPDRPHPAVLRSIDPGPINMSSYDGTNTDSSASAVYYNGILDVPNPDHTLRIQMTAQVSIVLQQADDALLIPSAALQQTGAQSARARTGAKAAGSGTSPDTTGTGGIRQAHHNTRAASATSPDATAHRPGKPYTVRVATGEPGEQTVQERTVYIGLNNRVQAQVLSGLEEGEQVVIGDGSGGSRSAIPRRARMF